MARRYHPAIQLLYMTNNEHLLPKEFRTTIPRGTRQGWRESRFEQCEGLEFSYIAEELSHVNELALRNKQLEKTIKTMIRSWSKIADAVMPVVREKGNEGLVLEQLERLFEVFPRQRVLKAAKMAQGTFSYRLAAHKKACERHDDDICHKRSPTKITPEEVKKIKALMEDESMSAWPMGSIYYHAYRNGDIHFGRHTFIKYAKELGYFRKFRKPKRKTLGVVSTKPNEYLHIDTTHVELPSGERTSTVFVVDNFSKMILGWSIGLHKSSPNVIAALRMAMGTIKELHPNLPCATLVADGGRENHSISVTEYLSSEGLPEIDKVIAQKDIIYSNSPSEALNRIMKRYIRDKSPQTLTQLETVLSDAVKDYTFVRPHNSLQGLTPFEVYTNNIPVIDFPSELEAARQKRYAINRLLSCGKC